MSGWLRHIELRAQARIGFDGQSLILAIVAVAASTAAVILLVIAAFIWLANRYDALAAGLVLGGAFVVIALISTVACLITRRRNMERARLELAARRSTAEWLDPKLLAVGFQLGQAIGWRKLASLAAVGLVAAGMAKEWFGGSEASPDEDGT